MRSNLLVPVEGLELPDRKLLSNALANLAQERGVRDGYLDVVRALFGCDDYQGALLCRRFGRDPETGARE